MGVNSIERTVKATMYEEDTFKNDNTVVDAVIPPILQPEEGSSGRFHIIQEMNEDILQSHLEFPALDSGMVLNVAASAPSISKDRKAKQSECKEFVESNSLNSKITKTYKRGKKNNKHKEVHLDVLEEGEIDCSVAAKDGGVVNILSQASKVNSKKHDDATVSSNHNLQYQVGYKLVVEMEKDLHSQKEVLKDVSLPSIPHHVDSHNRFTGRADEEDVTTSKLASEYEVSSSKLSSSEPVLGSMKCISVKSKATGLFPIGALTSNKKGKPLSDVNNISVAGLMESLSVMGMSFSSSIIDRQDMFNNLADNHKEFSIVER